MMLNFCIRISWAAKVFCIMCTSLYLYCRFQVTFQCAVAKFVANLPIMLSSSEVGRELRCEVRAQLPNLERNWQVDNKLGNRALKSNMKSTITKISYSTLYCHLMLFISKFLFSSRFSDVSWKYGRECQLS